MRHLVQAIVLAISLTAIASPFYIALAAPASLAEPPAPFVGVSAGTAVNGPGASFGGC
ncbi:MAG: hypothetical protein ACYDAG_12180 [Chloroflexota bacterium]